MTSQELPLFSLSRIRRPLLAGLVLLATSQVWAFQSASSGGAVRTAGTRGSGGAPTVNAPEINPALVVGAVVLLVGGILILTSRRRRVTGIESR
jgi:hypothetical protein